MSTPRPLRPRRPRRSRRAHRERRDPRAWLALWCVLMIAACYVSGWAFWSYTHLHLRLDQRPPGEAGRSSKGSPFRVLSMVQTPQLAGEYEQFRAAPGMTFVAVRYEVTRATEQESCLFELAGAGARAYDRSTKVYGRKPPSFCSDFPVGVPSVGELVFEIPINQVDRIVGLHDTTQRDWRVRHLALRPPA